MGRKVEEIFNALDNNRHKVKISKPIGKVSNFKMLPGSKLDLTEVLFLFDAVMDENEMSIKDIYFTKKIKNEYGYKILKLNENLLAPKIQSLFKEVIKLRKKVIVDNEFEKAYSLPNLKVDKRTIMEGIYIIEAITVKTGFDTLDFFLKRGIYADEDED